MEEELPFCECGECGLRVTKSGNRFIHGHNRRGKKCSTTHIANLIKSWKTRPTVSDDARLKMSETRKGIPWTDRRKKIALKEKDPLPNGWKIKEDSKIATNKECGSYLGCYIAEQVLSKIFKEVKMMPYGNHGFDIICNKDKKIDIKSAATGDKYGNWIFYISRNKIPDYFLCIAFDNRDELNPLHLWLIPGEDINHQVSITISKINIHKWDKYEQPLDKVIKCCNNMRGN